VPAYVENSYPYVSQNVSATAYQFREEQADAIIRTTAYHRRDFGLSVIWFSSREHIGIRQSIATPFPRTPRTGLGSLGQLPSELLQDVLLHLDMRSLFKFRQAGLRSRQSVDSLFQYQRVVSHGLNLFLALLRTRVALDVSLFDFYQVLCTKACILCGEFGGFMSLLTWSRICFDCLQRAPETEVQTMAAARKRFRLTKMELKQLRSFKTIPGKYSIWESAYKFRVSIVSVHQACLVSKQQPHPPALAQPANSGRIKNLNFMASCALPYYDPRTGKVDHGISCAGCQLALEKGIIGRRGDGSGHRTRNKVYATGGFLAHFRWCEQAQLLWESSGEGSRRPSDLPEFARRRGHCALIE